MSDLYTRLVNDGVGQKIAETLGLPRPTELRRHDPSEPPLAGPVLVAGDGGLAANAAEVARAMGLTVHDDLADPDDTPRYAALVFDATGITSADGLAALHDVFHTAVRRLGASARVVVLSRPPASCADAAAHAAQRGLEGFVRSLGKELRAGGTANLVEVAPDAATGLAAPLRFLLSGRSAFVSGQVVRVHAGGSPPPADPMRPLDGRTAVVTGAARGIGAAIARTLARDGATVVCIDLPSAGDDLAAVANEVEGTALQLDVTADDAGARIVEHVRGRHGRLDIVVHNAGITRDRTIAGMERGQWDLVLAINLAAIEAIDRALLDEDVAGDVLGDDPRIVCVSSMGGIAGNRGQTNYATSKAAVVGHVAALADELAERGGTINAVAPGFIETAMTAKMPLGPRELGRRLNSLSQGGLPLDVAETIGFFAWPDSDGCNGTTLRVCGQNLLGA